MIIPGHELFTLCIPGVSSFRSRKLPYFPPEKVMFPLAEPLYDCNKTLQGAVTNCLIITTPTNECSQCVPAQIRCGQIGQHHHILL